MSMFKNFGAWFLAGALLFAPTAKAQSFLDEMNKEDRASCVVRTRRATLDSKKSGIITQAAPQIKEYKAVTASAYIDRQRKLLYLDIETQPDARISADCAGSIVKVICPRNLEIDENQIGYRAGIIKNGKTEWVDLKRSDVCRVISKSLIDGTGKLTETALGLTSFLKPFYKNLSGIQAGKEDKLDAIAERELNLRVSNNHEVEIPNYVSKNPLSSKREKLSLRLKYFLQVRQDEKPVYFFLDVPVMKGANLGEIKRWIVPTQEPAGDLEKYALSVDELSENISLSSNIVTMNINGKIIEVDGEEAENWFREQHSMNYDIGKERVNKEDPGRGYFEITSVIPNPDPSVKYNPEFAKWLKEFTNPDLSHGIAILKKGNEYVYFSGDFLSGDEHRSYRIEIANTIEKFRRRLKLEDYWKYENFIKFGN